MRKSKRQMKTSGSPLPETGWHMMPWQAFAFVRAAHGHAQALRTWPPK